MSSVYLDSASGAPLHPRVARGFMEALQAISEGGDSPLLANPNSLHRPAQQTRKLIRETSDLVLRSLGLSSSSYRVLFTSSGTEAIQTVIRSVVLERPAGQGSPPVWLLSAIEHSCNRSLLPEAEVRGVRVKAFGMDLQGDIQGRDGILSSHQTPGAGPGLLSILSVQNETGITSHILGAKQLSRQLNLQLCIDHVAGWGKVELPFSELEPDYIAVSGHKIGAFAGIGALVYRIPEAAAQLRPLLTGSQQAGLRGGTENTAGILSLKLALEGKLEDEDTAHRVRALRDRFEMAVKSTITSARILGEDAQRSPYVSSVSFQGLPKALELVTRLDLMRISVSSGSACQSAVPKPSFVLLHYGLNEVDARNTLRVSLHDHSRWEDLQALLDALKKLIPNQNP